MIFTPTAIDGVYRIAIEPHRDERGFFARTFSADEMIEHDLPGHFEESSLSRNTLAGTLRGMHYQDAPFAEAKLVRCVRGAIFDVAVDLREGSPTRGQWVGESLTAENGLALYIGPGMAHGFQTLVENSDVLYQITPKFTPGHGKGVRWNDPIFEIDWPMPDPVLSERDATYPDWRP